MSAFKIVKNVPKLSGISTTGPIPLQSGYIRIVPESDAYVELGYNPSVNTSTSLWIKAGDVVVLKESVRSQLISDIAKGSSTVISLPSGLTPCIEVGDYVSLSGVSPIGMNTSFARVSATYKDSLYQDKIVLDWNTSAVSGTITLSSDAEIRKAIKIAANSSGSTHISEVQITNTL